MLVTKRTLMPNIFDELFNDLAITTSNNKNTVPAVNITEKDQFFTLKLAAPGLQKSDFKIDIEDDVLSISTAFEASKDQDSYTLKEYSFHNFKRTFNLPEDINQEAIKANYINGELILELPKLEEVKPKAKLIEVQ